MEKQLFSNKIHENMNLDSTFFLDKNLELETTYNYLHSHNIYEIGIVANGSGLFIVNDHIYTYGRGDITIAIPGDMHISNSSNNQKSIWHYINFDLNKLSSDNVNTFLEISKILSEKSILSGVYPQRKYPRIHQYVHLLMHELSEKSYAYNETSYHLLAALLIELCRISDIKPNKVHIDMKKYEIITPALSYITSSYSENITAKELADLCFISETHLRRLFREVLNISPMDYLYKTRVSASKSLLKTTSMSIIEISQAVGYQTQTSFNSHFKKFAKTTPTQYRKNSQ